MSVMHRSHMPMLRGCVPAPQVLLGLVASYCRRFQHGMRACAQEMSSNLLPENRTLLLPQAGLNLDDAVARMGLSGPERRSLWVTTTTEALYAWDWAAACDEITEGAPDTHLPGICRPYWEQL